MGAGDSGGAPSLSDPMVFKRIFPLTRSAYNYRRMPYIYQTLDEKKERGQVGKIAEFITSDVI